VPDLGYPPANRPEAAGKTPTLQCRQNGLPYRADSISAVRALRTAAYFRVSWAPAFRCLVFCLHACVWAPAKRTRGAPGFHTTHTQHNRVGPAADRSGARAGAERAFPVVDRTPPAVSVQAAARTLMLAGNPASAPNGHAVHENRGSPSPAHPPGGAGPRAGQARRRHGSLCRSEGLRPFPSARLKGSGGEAGPGPPSTPITWRVIRGVGIGRKWD